LTIHIPDIQFEIAITGKDAELVVETALYALILLAQKLRRKQDEA